MEGLKSDVKWVNVKHAVPPTGCVVIGATMLEGKWVTTICHYEGYGKWQDDNRPYMDAHIEYWAKLPRFSAEVQ